MGERTLRRRRDGGRSSESSLLSSPSAHLFFPPSKKFPTLFLPHPFLLLHLPTWYCTTTHPVLRTPGRTSKEERGQFGVFEWCKRRRRRRRLGPGEQSEKGDPSFVVSPAVGGRLFPCSLSIPFFCAAELGRKLFQRAAAAAAAAATRDAAALIGGGGGMNGITRTKTSEETMRIK